MKKTDKPHNKMPLRRHNIDSIPSHITGVYAFWCRTNGRCIYVGKAEKQPIKVRLMQEWRDSHNKNLKLWIRVFGKHLDICYLPVKDKQVNRIETKLIRMWHPETNILKQKR